MPREQDLQEYTPRNHFEEDDWELGNYWTEDNQVYFRSTPLWRADKASFRLFRNGFFAKDRLHCYWFCAGIKNPRHRAKSVPWTQKMRVLCASPGRSPSS
jgi:hypothetical protein